MLINSSYLIAFLLAIIIEITVAVFFGYKKKLEIVTIVFINLITNPLLNYFLSVNNYFRLMQVSTITIIFLEIIVILVEWLLLLFALKQKPTKLLIMSIAMNLCSYIVGVILFR